MATREVIRSVETAESIAWTADMVRRSEERCMVTLIELNRTTTTTTTDTVDEDTDEVLDTDVTVVVLDVPTGRRWQEPFDGTPAGLPGLKSRFRASVIADNAQVVADANLLDNIRTYLASL